MLLDFIISLFSFVHHDCWRLVLISPLVDLFAVPFHLVPSFFSYLSLSSCLSPSLSGTFLAFAAHAVIRVSRSSNLYQYRSNRVSFIQAHFLSVRVSVGGCISVSVYVYVCVLIWCFSHFFFLFLSLIELVMCQNPSLSIYHPPLYLSI